MPSWSNISSNESLTIEGVKEIDQGRDVQMGKQNNTKTKILIYGQALLMRLLASSLCYGMYWNPEENRAYAFCFMQ